MSLISSIQHGLAAGFGKLKTAAKEVETVILPELVKLNAEAPVITAVANASGIAFVQSAARVEESLVGWAINFIDEAEKAGTDPATVLGDLVGDIKAIAPTIKAAAIPVGAPVPATK